MSVSVPSYVADVRAARLNFTVQRTVRVLEILALGEVSAPQLADVLRVDPRTARGILRTLVDTGYVSRRVAQPRPRGVYRAELRLFSLVAQLAQRHPGAAAAARCVRRLAHETGLGAFAAIPSCADALVLACAGDGAPAPWSLHSAAESAAGQVLLAYRTAWRASQRRGEEFEQRAAQIRRAGYSLVKDLETATIAVPASPHVDVMVAFALVVPIESISGNRRRLLTPLRAAAVAYCKVDGATIDGGLPGVAVPHPPREPAFEQPARTRA